MRTAATEIIVDGLSFPESPRWHNGALWFSDIHAHRVYRVADGKPEMVADIGDRASGLGFLADGSLLVVSMLDRKLIAVGPDGQQRIYADVSPLSRNFINDMVVDAKGRAYVGSRNGGTPASKSDSLLLALPDGTTRILRDDMVTPNGSVITPDGRFLIIAETALGRLDRFALNPDGTLGERTILCELPGRHIDGICLDTAGGVWCGGGNGGLLYVGPDGALERAIDFPGRMVLATALGGPDGRTLFLATTATKLIENLAYIGADRARDAEVNSDGRIEAITVDVPGVDQAASSAFVRGMSPAPWKPSARRTMSAALARGL